MRGLEVVACLSLMMIIGASDMLLFKTRVLSTWINSKSEMKRYLSKNDYYIWSCSNKEGSHGSK
jgi:hypothetical protein